MVVQRHLAESRNYRLSAPAAARQRMVLRTDQCGTERQSGSAVLMARLVDNTGRTIRPQDVVSIKYWIYEVKRGRPRRRRVVAGHNGVSLDVRSLLIKPWQPLGSWGVDAIGYNFRHEFTLAGVENSTAEKQFEICYRLMPAIGQEMIITFRWESFLR
jgi:hypothetical protein